MAVRWVNSNPLTSCSNRHFALCLLQPDVLGINILDQVAPPTSIQQCHEILLSCRGLVLLYLHYLKQRREKSNGQKQRSHNKLHTHTYTHKHGSAAVPANSWDCSETHRAEHRSRGKNVAATTTKTRVAEKVSRCVYKTLVEKRDKYIPKVDRVRARPRCETEQLISARRQRERQSKCKEQRRFRGFN